MIRFHSYLSIVPLLIVMMTSALPLGVATAARANGQPFRELQYKIDDVRERVDSRVDSLEGEVDLAIQEMTERLAGLEAYIEAYKAQAEAEIASLKTQLDAEAAKRIAAVGLLNDYLDQEQSHRIAADGDIWSQLDDMVIPGTLLDLADYVRVVPGDVNGLSGPHVMVEGANFHVRSGSGYTSDGGVPSGLGNLIVGYNEPREFLTQAYLESMLGTVFSPCFSDVHDPYDFDFFDSFFDDDFDIGAYGVSPCSGLLISRRGGSHNLIVGEYHNYNSYSGIIGGMLNATDQYAVGASVLGGMSNLVTHPMSSIVGGASNIVSAGQSSILGGRSNKISAYFDDSERPPPAAGDLGGGRGQHSSIVGGYQNTVRGQKENVIVGGEENLILWGGTTTSTIVGGMFNLIGGNSSIGEPLCGGAVGDTCNQSVILGGQGTRLTNSGQVQPLDAAIEGLAAAAGGGSCSDETKWYLDAASLIPGVGWISGWFSSGCDIW